MNGASGFQEVRSSSSRSPTSRFLREQRHQCGTGFGHFLHAKKLPRMVPQVRMKNCFLLSTPIPTNSCLNIRRVQIDKSVHPFTLLEEIR
jgi:hypothetical protein